MAHDVFISHASKDKGIANAICGKLESARVRCWVAPRDILAGEDWTVAIRNAIGSSRLMVFVFSENANAAPHIEREIAHAFYTRRTIIPFRSTEVLPRREFLFYLGDIRWFDAVSSPAEQHLEGLTARVKEMLFSPAPFNGAGTRDLTLIPVDARLGELRVHRYRIPTILKRIMIVGSVPAAVVSLWLVSEQTKSDMAYEGRNLPPMHQEARTSPTQARGAVPASAPHYTFTRFGLWEAANSSAAPAVQPAPQATPSTMPAAQLEGATPSLPLIAEQNTTREEQSSAIPSNQSVEAPRDKHPQIVKRHERHRRGFRSKNRGGLSLANVKGWLTALWRKAVD